MTSGIVTIERAFYPDLGLIAVGVIVCGTLWLLWSCFHGKAQESGPVSAGSLVDRSVSSWPKLAKEYSASSPCEMGGGASRSFFEMSDREVLAAAERSIFAPPTKGAA